MSFMYSIVAIIEADYHPDHVENVLTKGKQFGCKYFKEIIFANKFIIHSAKEEQEGVKNKIRRILTKI